MAHVYFERINSFIIIIIIINGNILLIRTVYSALMTTNTVTGTAISTDELRIHD